MRHKMAIKAWLLIWKQSGTFADKSNDVQSLEFEVILGRNRLSSEKFSY